ncbi:hypothetical protein GCM10011578_078760 [Streptomyces fuscichromogenes]|uniref:Uncharacterized protein n=1 Tax=Streptomyces fuscichromogenes TaxID=1324013 RepID=A0A917XL50_9ACTN|nr:hypothetical protein GCM10011578_078760 [Streptomyces fuscichromogenes]
MRTRGCRNAYIDGSQSNVSASLRGDPLHGLHKIPEGLLEGRAQSGDVSL